MRKYNILLSIVIIFTVTIFSLTVAVNIVYRSSYVYSFYFNDTRVVEKLYTSRSANEMADEISGYLNSFTDEPFYVVEDTGYDLENIFTEDEGLNMQKIKKALDKSLLYCIISFAISCYIYLHFLKDSKKKVLRDRYYISLGIGVATFIFEIAFILSTNGKAKAMQWLGLIELPENNYLSLLLGNGFLEMSIKFFIAISIVVFIAVSYFVFKFTKPDRIFF